MIGAFSYKGVPSSKFDLICKSVKRPLLSSLKSNITQLPSSSGVYDSGGTEYDLRNITMKIQYVAKKTSSDEISLYYELRERARAIAEWLGGGEWGKLIITGEEDKYYLAKIEEEIILDTIFDFGEADIPFVCQPFAYSIDDLTFSGSGTIQINNPGTRRIDCRSPEGSLFKINFTGNGYSNFYMNGRSIGYNGSGNIVIDNVAMRVTGGQFANLTGEIDRFLELRPGLNTLTITGATNVVVTIRPMFL